MDPRIIRERVREREAKIAAKENKVRLDDMRPALEDVGFAEYHTTAVLDGIRCWRLSLAVCAKLKQQRLKYHPFDGRRLQPPRRPFDIVDGLMVWFRLVLSHGA